MTQIASIVNKTHILVNKEDKSVIYVKNGQKHRSYGPAVIYSDGTKEYYMNGKLHRLGDLPARIYSIGRKEYWVNGELHRHSGPAVIYADGGTDYYKYNKLHRKNGPARIHSNGHTEYWINSNRHNTKKPSEIHADGKEVWYEDNKWVPSAYEANITRERIKRKIGKNILKNNTQLLPS